MNSPRHLVGCVLSLILLFSLQQHEQQAPDAKALGAGRDSLPVAIAHEGGQVSGDDETLDGQLQAQAITEVLE